MKILITGATGFVGSHLTDLLHKNGHEIYSLIRNLKKADEFRIKGHYITGPLESEQPNTWIKELPSDLDAVVHAAGIVHTFKTSDFFKVNTLSTKQLIQDLTPLYKNLKFIFISSLAAAGPSSSYQNETESPVPVSEYGRSKLQAELVLLKEAPLEWKKVIIRPPMVIGPRDPAVLDVFKLVKQGIVPSVGKDGAQKTYSFIGIFDLIETIKMALENEEVENEIFYSSHPDSFKYHELLEVLASVMKVKKPKLLPLPLLLVKLVTKLFAIAGPKSIRLTPDKLFELTPPAWTCSGAKAEKILGQKYTWDLERIIKAALEDYRNRKWI